jgi:hypothetical protein
VVGKLRSFSDAKVAQKAKETVKKWKGDVLVKSGGDNKKQQPQSENLTRRSSNSCKHAQAHMKCY